MSCQGSCKDSVHVNTFREDRPVVLGVLKGDLLDSEKFMNVGLDDPLVKKSLIVS